MAQKLEKTLVSWDDSKPPGKTCAVTTVLFLKHSRSWCEPRNSCRCNPTAAFVSSQLESFKAKREGSGQAPITKPKRSSLFSRVLTQRADRVGTLSEPRGSSPVVGQHVFEISWVGSGRVGSGRVGSGRVGSGRVGSGRVGSPGFQAHGSGRITLTQPNPTREM